jgi:dihydroorotase
MANTNPPLDAAAGVLALKKRADALGLLDLYPAMALTRGMAGETLSEIAAADLPAAIRLFSEDGKDVACDALLLAAFKEAGRLGIPVSCHCDAGGAEAEQAKRAGEPRSAWSRIEENRGIQRCIALGRSAGGHIHIAHVSTKESAAMIRKAKAERTPGFVLTCEATPHHLVFTEADADRLGPESAGRVNPPLRAEADRQALIAAVLDGTADAIATDHAPHTEADKSLGSPGFTGLETAFGLCLTELVRADRLGLSRLSALMSAAPARLLGLRDRGRIAPGLRADLVIADCGALWQVQPETFKSRGKNSPASGLSLRGKVLMTIQQGRIVWEA